LLSAAAVVAVAAPARAAGPLDAPSSLPYQAPRFDLIKDKDYQPAFEQGMRQQLAEMETIANNKAEPTFDNTIVAMERSGRLLERVNNTFFGVVQADTNPALDKVQTVEAPKLAAHTDAIYLNEKLFARVKALYDRRAGLKLDSEALQVLTLYYRQFVHAGANLAPKDKARLREINKRDASLETDFQQKLVAAAKKNPGSFNYGSAGVGTATHISAERFRLSAGFEATHIPYKGGPEALTDVLGGRIDFYYCPISTAIPLVRDGRLLALAVSTPTRAGALPDVPTSIEAGYPNSDYTVWYGVFMPAKTPHAIVERFYTAAAGVLKNDKMKEKLAQLAVDPMPMTSAEFNKYVVDEIAANAQLVKAAGIK